MQRVVIELKIQRGNLDTLLAEALKQTYEYADKVNADETHIVIFNRDPEVSWNDKIWRRQETYVGRTIEVWGC